MIAWAALILSLLNSLVLLAMVGVGYKLSRAARPYLEAFGMVAPVTVQFDEPPVSALAEPSPPRCTSFVGAEHKQCALAAGHDGEHVTL